MRVKGVKRKKHILIMMLAALMLLLPTGILAGQTSDIEEHWAGGTLSQWLEQGLAAGYPDGTFKPDHFITRAEFMALTNRALDLTEKESIDYSDVPEDAWYAEAVKIAAAAGYISGYPDGSMKPDEQISRQETAVIIATIMELPAAAEKADRFTDAEDIPAWSKGQIGAAAQEEYMTGYPDGSFRPLNPITRAEAIVALDGLLAVEEMEEEAAEEEVIDEEEEKPVYYGGGGSSSKPRPPSAFSGGKGTANDPWQIATAQDLDKVRDYTSEEHSDKYFIQTADIDLATAPWNTDEGWEPIADFFGCYDGNFHTITGLTIYQPDENRAGLFARNHGLIENLILIEPQVEGKNQVGGLVGQNYSKISQCAVIDGEIDGQSNVGGLVGYNYTDNYGFGAEITKAFSSGTVSGYEYVGGLVGDVSYSAVSEAYSLANVNGDSCVGGLAGAMTFEVYVENTYAAGQINGTSQAGGLIGRAISVYPTNSYWDKDSSKLSGDDDGIGNVNFAQSGVAGFKTPAMIMETNSVPVYQNWNFDQIWTIEMGTSYPYFQWQNDENIPYPPEPEAEFAGGTGTENDPYQVAEAAHLNNVRYYLDQHFIQIADIDLEEYSSGNGFAPLGQHIASNDYEEFSGVYDGDGYVIKNLTISYTGNEHLEYALFSVTAPEALLKNILLEDVNVSTSNRAAALTGYNKGTIEDCGVLSGNVSGFQYVGGLVRINEGALRRSFSLADVSGGAHVGGLAGINSGIYSSGVPSHIEMCFAGGSVTGQQYIGGLAGSNNYYGRINDSYAVAEVTGEIYVGGLVGGSTDGNSVTNSYAAGRVSPLDPDSSNNIIGGLAGDTQTSGAISCYYDMNTTGQNSSALGTGKTTAEMQIIDTFSAWDFEEIWVIEQGTSYPYFIWQNNENIPYPPGPFAGGSGSSDDPYEIASAEQLDSVRNYLSSHFIQTADIDLSGIDWTPIGQIFSGTYNGQDNKISNLTKDDSTSTDFALFKELGPGAGLKNIIMDNVSIKGRDKLAALVSINKGLIDNCHVDDFTITGEKVLGGLVAVNEGDGVVKNSSSTNGTVTASEDPAGGLIGESSTNPGNEEAGIFSCFSDAEVSADEAAGGLVGAMNYGIIKDSHATGDVEVTEEDAGGLAGTIWNSRVEDSYATGTVSGLYEGTGGLIGDIGPNSTIKNCYAEGDVSGYNSVGGLGGYVSSNVVIIDSYASGQVQSTDRCAGGLIGSGGTSMTISGSFATGNVVGSNSYAGGLIGEARTGLTVFNSYAWGDVTGQREVGGLIGGSNLGSNMKVEYCYALGTVSGTSEVGGLIGGNDDFLVAKCYFNGSNNNNSYGYPKTDEELKNHLTYDGWDFDAIWDIDEGLSYPYLKWQATDSI